MTVLGDLVKRKRQVDGVAKLELEIRRTRGG